MHGSRASAAKGHKSVSDGDSEASQPDCETGLVSESHDDPFFDDELVKYGGRYNRKVCVGQVTIRLPLDWHPLNLIALLYGFLPWLVPLAFAASFVTLTVPEFSKGFADGMKSLEKPNFPAFGTYLSTTLALLNEGILKPLIKQDRPRQSANRYKDGRMKPGMPSGHVLNAVSMMVWSLFEVTIKGSSCSGSRWSCLILSMGLPVAWARWYTKDHSLKQCLVSCILGFACGTLAFYIRISYFAKPTSLFCDTFSHR